VREPERMADLVGRQLSHAVQRHGDGRGVVAGGGCEVVEAGQEPLAVQIVLAQAQAAQVDVALDDLARARIADGPP
jgi:hypothetical protein